MDRRLSRITKPPLRLSLETESAMMFTENAPTMVGSIDVVFVVVVNIELAGHNDRATPEPGVCSENTGMGWEPPSSIVASDRYNVVGKNEN